MEYATTLGRRRRFAPKRKTLIKSTAANRRQLENAKRRMPTDDIALRLQSLRRRAAALKIRYV